MEIWVDEALCGLHGQCVFAAPEIFRFDDDGELQYVAQVEAELEDKARAAAAICPTAAIELSP